MTRIEADAAEATMADEDDAQVEGAEHAETHEDALDHRTPLEASESALQSMTTDERADVLMRVSREGPGRTEPDWLIVDSAMRVREAVRDAAAKLEEVNETLEAVRALQAEINETAADLAAEREERIGKLVAPMADLAASLGAMKAGEQRAAGAKDVEDEARRAINSVVDAARRALDVTARRQTALPWITVALLVLDLIATIILLLRR